MYLQLPKDKRGKGLVSKLKHGIYELNDEPRVWYDEWNEKSEMKRFVAAIIKFDKRVFMGHENEKLVGLLVSHVDDFFWLLELVGTDIWK